MDEPLDARATVDRPIPTPPLSVRERAVRRSIIAITVWLGALGAMIIAVRFEVGPRSQTSAPTTEFAGNVLMVLGCSHLGASIAMATRTRFGLYAGAFCILPTALFFPIGTLLVGFGIRDLLSPEGHRFFGMKMSGERQHPRVAPAMRIESSSSKAGDSSSTATHVALIQTIAAPNAMRSVPTTQPQIEREILAPPIDE